MNRKPSSRLRVNRRRSREAPFAIVRNVMLLMSYVCLGCGTHAGQSATCPTIEVRAVADVQTDSTKLAASNDSTKAPLTRTPLVTGADITGANASLTEGQWVLNLDLTDEAVKRVQDFSKQHVGQTMAFLVDGKVQSTPRIMDPITARGFLIGGLGKADAERLATAISGCKR